MREIHGNLDRHVRAVAPLARTRPSSVLRPRAEGSGASHAHTGRSAVPFLPDDLKLPRSFASRWGSSPARFPPSLSLSFAGDSPRRYPRSLARVALFLPVETALDLGPGRPFSAKSGEAAAARRRQPPPPALSAAAARPDPLATVRSRSKGLDPILSESTKPNTG